MAWRQEAAVPEPPRGKLPDDDRLFGSEALPALRLAAEETAWMIGRGYPQGRVTEMVSERHGLGERQRLAVERGICSDPQYRRRAVRELDAEDIQRRPLRIDAENLLVTIEVALAGGPLLSLLDGSVSNLAWSRGAHGPVAETDAALERIGAAVRRLKPSVSRWYLGNGAEGAQSLADRITAAGPRWKVPVEIKRVDDVAATLGKASQVVSSDPLVLDECGSWFNLAPLVIGDLTSAWKVTLQ